MKILICDWCSKFKAQKEQQSCTFVWNLPFCKVTLLCIVIVLTIKFLSSSLERVMFHEFRLKCCYLNAIFICKVLLEDLFGKINKRKKKEENINEMVPKSNSTIPIFWPFVQKGFLSHNELDQFPERKVARCGIRQ